MRGDRFLIVDDVLLPLYEKFRGADELRARDRRAAHRHSRSTAGLRLRKARSQKGRPLATAGARRERTRRRCATPRARPAGRKASSTAIARSCCTRFATATVDYLGVSNRDTVCPVVPMFHVNAWGLPFTALMMGAKLAMPGPHLDAVSLLDLYRIGAGHAVARACRRSGSASSRRSSASRDAGGSFAGMRMVVGGAAAPEALIRGLDRFGLNVMHGWGMTETSPVGLVNFAKREHRARWTRTQRYALRAKQGVPLPFFEVRAIRRERRSAVGRRDDGRARGARAVGGGGLSRPAGSKRAVDRRRLVSHRRHRHDRRSRLREDHRSHQGPRSSRAANGSARSISRTRSSRIPQCRRRR